VHSDQRLTRLPSPGDTLVPLRARAKRLTGIEVEWSILEDDKASGELGVEQFSPVHKKVSPSQIAGQAYASSMSIMLVMRPVFEMVTLMLSLAMMTSPLEV
jgi:hypothetical protein